MTELRFMHPEDLQYMVDEAVNTGDFVKTCIYYQVKLVSHEFLQVCDSESPYDYRFELSLVQDENHYSGSCPVSLKRIKTKSEFLGMIDSIIAQSCRSFTEQLSPKERTLFD